MKPPLSWWFPWFSWDFLSFNLSSLWFSSYLLLL